MIIGIFSHFFAVETTLAERQFFRALAKLIGRRAARLSSCGIAAIVSKMGYLDEGCQVGADGSLYNVCPLSVAFFIGLLIYYHAEIPWVCWQDTWGTRRYLWRERKVCCSLYQVLASFKVFLNNFKRNIITHHAEDGSGVGSAIIAGSCVSDSSYIIDWFSTYLGLAMTRKRKDAGLYVHLWPSVYQRKYLNIFFFDYREFLFVLWQKDVIMICHYVHFHQDRA